MVNNERWSILCECADFGEVNQAAQMKYGNEYPGIFDELEKELENYLNSSDEEIQELVEADEIPTVVKWYTGMLETDYFIECL